MHGVAQKVCTYTQIGQPRRTILIEPERRKHGKRSVAIRKPDYILIAFFTRLFHFFPFHFLLHFFHQNMQTSDTHHTATSYVHTEDASVKYARSGFTTSNITMTTTRLSIIAPFSLSSIFSGTRGRWLKQKQTQDIHTDRPNDHNRFSKDEERVLVYQFCGS